MSKDSDPKQWYKDNRYLKQADIGNIDAIDELVLTVDRVGADKPEYFLCKFGHPIGKLDPKRRWSQKLILKQEEWDNVHEAKPRAWPEDHDTATDGSQPVEWQEGRPPEGDQKP